MEYRTSYLVILGLLGAIVWSLDFWKVFYPAKIRLPALNRNGQNSPLNQWKIVRWILFIVGIMAWLSLSYSMMSPRKPESFRPSNIEINDIYFVVDVSRSMLADDLQPNRLEVAKKKLQDFANLRPTDRIGVIIFSEEVFTLLPLTTDPGLVDRVIGDIKVGLLGSGTNIGDALGLAVARAVGSETKNKVIILLTDGVSNAGNITPIQAAENARDYNIKVYTIGIGTDDSARIPIGKTVFGTRYQTIPGGSIDIETLEKISNMTGGKSFLANSEGSLASIFNEIEQLEKTKIKAQNQIVYKELFFEYLMIGVILLALVELSRKLWLREIL